MTDLPRLTAAQWLVLDNVKMGWHYRTNLDSDRADEAYLWCVRNEYIQDGKIAAAGLGVLAANPYPRG